MKKFFPILLLLSILAAQSFLAQPLFKYTLDVSNYAEDDLFHVTMSVNDLTIADSLYNFVAYAPGVHQPLYFGRFVQTFEAFDAENQPIDVSRKPDNSWLIKQPHSVSLIRYSIEDAYDSEILEQGIFPMASTGIEPEHIIVNTFGLFGYFDNHKTAPIEVQIIKPEGWRTGTALKTDTDGVYKAESIHHLYDSPILMGELTTSKIQLGKIDVEAYVYSPNPVINADTVLALADGVLQSAKDFIEFTPVDRYTFLMCFFDQEDMQRNKLFGGGALEHSYSSTYALPAFPQVLNGLADIIAHEFMHVLTPLHLRSELIADFDYQNPSKDDLHLWLYEGVTEWTSDIMQLRSDLISIEDYLVRISDKMTQAENFAPDYSLVRLSTEWHTPEGGPQFPNIYQKGALTMALLDILLLEKSDGTRGLREVYLELIKEYGKDKPFNNDNFFEVFVSKTYPEVEDFINKYIKGTDPLPVEEYFGKMGIAYIPERPSERTTPRFGLSLGSMDGKQLMITGLSKENEGSEFKRGDIIKNVFGREITIASQQEIFGMRDTMEVGDEYEMIIIRDGEEIIIKGKLLQRMDYHIFDVDNNATSKEKELLSTFKKNLPL